MLSGCPSGVLTTVPFLIVTTNCVFPPGTRGTGGSLKRRLTHRRTSQRRICCSVSPGRTRAQLIPARISNHPHRLWRSSSSPCSTTSLSCGARFFGLQPAGAPIPWRHRDAALATAGEIVCGALTMDHRSGGTSALSSISPSRRNESLREWRTGRSIVCVPNRRALAPEKDGKIAHCFQDGKFTVGDRIGCWCAPGFLRNRFVLTPQKP